MKVLLTLPFLVPQCWFPPLGSQSPGPVWFPSSGRTSEKVCFSSLDCLRQPPNRFHTAAPAFSLNTEYKHDMRECQNETKSHLRFRANRNYESLLRCAIDSNLLEISSSIHRLLVHIISRIALPTIHRPYT